MTLLKVAHPDKCAVTLRSALVTDAKPLDRTQSPIRGNGNPLQYASLLVTLLEIQLLHGDFPTNSVKKKIH